MHPGVFATTLKQDMIATLGPSRSEGSVNDGPPMALVSKCRMSNDIFEKPMPAAAAQQIWRSDKHASRNDLAIDIGYKHGDALI
jgi:hypothetical protein